MNMENERDKPGRQAEGLDEQVAEQMTLHCRTDVFE